MIEDVFATPIGQYELDIDCLELERYILNMKEKDPKGRTISNVGGYQSNPLDLNDKNFKVFLDKLLLKLKEYSSIFEISLNTKIHDYWFNINNLKHGNKLHNHSGAFLSGVFYVKIPKNSGKLYFQNVKASHDNCFKSKTLNTYNKYRSNYYNITPKENLLVLFPGWLDHLVESNNSNENRISISFNTVIE
tara:strand:- start:1244 stop:1816 length:573 start_codon:yes stop_codon:yes gene_type:complete